MILPLQHPK
ncbi:hypothetical protein AAY473_007634 [Plecturocebus cupreus]